MSPFKIVLKLLFRTFIVNTMVFGGYLLFTNGIGAAIIFFFTMVFLFALSLCISPVLTALFNVIGKLPYSNNSCVGWFAFAWNLIAVSFFSGIYLLFDSEAPDAFYIILVSLSCWIAIYKTRRPVLNFIKKIKTYENNMI